MDKELIKKEDVVSTVKEFYNPLIWHFVMINGIDLGDKLEIQWVFSKMYEKDIIKVFYAELEYEEEIPSIKDIIKVAWVSEAETKDLLGANFSDTASNLFLEVDAPKTPLRKGDF